MKAFITASVSNVTDVTLSKKLQNTPHVLHKGKKFISNSQVYLVEEVSTDCEQNSEGEIWIEIKYKLSTTFCPVY